MELFTLRVASAMEIITTTEVIVLVFFVQHTGRPNVFTLSCKNRLPCMCREAARRLPRPTRSRRSELQPTWRARAVRAARGGSPPSQRIGGFCQLV